MVLHENQIQNIAQLIREAAESVSEAQLGDISKPGFSMHDNVMYLSSENSDLKITQAVSVLYRVFSDKYTERQLKKDVMSLLARQLRDIEYDATSELGGTQRTDGTHPIW